MKNQKSLISVTLVIALVAVWFCWIGSNPSESSAQRGTSVQRGTRVQESTEEAPPTWQYARLVVNDQQVTWLVGNLNFVPRPQTIARTNQQLGGRQARANLANLLDTIGSNGWELVQVNGSTWVFKRERRAVQ